MNTYEMKRHFDRRKTMSMEQAYPELVTEAYKKIWSELKNDKY